MQKVIVTGAAGFIGGQTMLALRDQGIWVMGIDRRPLPDHLRSVPDSFLMNDFADRNALFAINSHHADAVIHCAGTSLVGPSMVDPSEYYDNNFVKTKILADHLLRYSLPTRLVFSSSASVYGAPVFTPCAEADPIMPISPYGESKAMIEWLLSSYQRAYGFDYVSFRYFNACGADPKHRHGQEPRATHIIARVLESLRDNTEFNLYGTDYNTADGTCVRDYIHVDDLARAHVLAIDKKYAGGAYNLGTGHGHSNREIMHIAERITGRTLWTQEQAARPGDPAVLTAESVKWQETSGWRPSQSIESIITDAWRWYVQ